MSLPKVLVIIGIVLAFGGAIVDFLLSLNHRGKYWRAYRVRFGFYILLGVITAIIAWISVSFWVALLIIEATGLIVCAGIYLFDNWRGKLPRPLVDRLRGAAAMIIVLGVATTIAPLVFR